MAAAKGMGMMYLVVPVLLAVASVQSRTRTGLDWETGNWAAMHAKYRYSDEFHLVHYSVASSYYLLIRLRDVCARTQCGDALGISAGGEGTQGVTMWVHGRLLVCKGSLACLFGPA